MFIYLGQPPRPTPGPSLVINCPACQSQDVAAETSTKTERIAFLAVIPLYTSRQVTVTCSSCGATFGSSKPADQLPAMPRGELDDMLQTWHESSVYFIVKACIIANLVTWIVPILGLLLGLINVLFTFRRKSRWRIAAWIGLSLGAIISIGGTIVSLMPNKR